MSTQTLIPKQRTREAIIRFRRDQLSSGVSRTGQLYAGSQLIVEYDPLRLIDANVEASEVVCHARFQPSGKEHSAALEFPTSGAPHAQRTSRAGLFQTTIPEESTLVELWFEWRGRAGPEGWDSRYGQNYTFPVVRDGLPVPEQSVTLRPEAIIDPGRIQVVQDAAAKAQTQMGLSGSALHTELRVSAKISRPTELTTAWADIHVFDATWELIYRETIALHRPDSVGVDKTTHTWSASVYQGSGGGSGAGVWSRPDAHAVQYRLYCQVAEQLFTDGVLHEFDVAPDAEVHPIPGSW